MESKARAGVSLMLVWGTVLVAHLVMRRNQVSHGNVWDASAYIFGALTVSATFFACYGVWRDHRGP